MLVNPERNALDKMSLVELKAIAPMIPMKIAEREKAEKEAVKAELAAMAKSNVFDCKTYNRDVFWQYVFDNGKNPLF